MTKTDAVQNFKHGEFPTLAALEVERGTKDRPARRESWNNYTDMLCKQGDITENQYNKWHHPEGLETWNAKLYI